MVQWLLGDVKVPSLNLSLIFTLIQLPVDLSKSLKGPGIKPGTNRTPSDQCDKTNLLPRAVNFKSELIKNQQESVKCIKERPGT